MLLLLVGLAYGWWYLANGRFPLAGDLRHDFGDVPIYGRTGVVEHTFQLRNRTSQVIVIDRVVPGCGCTKIEEVASEVAPGESVEITVALTLSHAGKKKSDVTLVLGDLGIQKLWIQGVGRKEMGIWPASNYLYLAPGEPTPMIVFVEIQNNDEQPPTPTIKTPQGVEASFVEWELVSARDSRMKKPARWRGRFSVEVIPETLLEGARLSITVGKAEPVAVELIETPGPRDGDTRAGEKVES